MYLCKLNQSGARKLPGNRPSISGKRCLAREEARGLDGKYKTPSTNKQLNTSDGPGEENSINLGSHLGKDHKQFFSRHSGDG